MVEGSERLWEARKERWKVWEDWRWEVVRARDSAGYVMTLVRLLMK